MIKHRLSTVLDKLADYAQLDEQELKAMPLAQLKPMAADLGLRGGYKLRKAELIKSVWEELEQLKAQLNIAQSEKEQGEQAIKGLKKDVAYSIPINEVVSKVYSRLREVASKGESLQSMKEEINGLVASVARQEMREFAFSTVKSRRKDIHKGLTAHASQERILRDDIEVLIEYFYHQLLSFQREDSIALSKSYRQSVGTKNREKQPIEISQLFEDCEHTLNLLEQGKNPHWTKISIALALGTGRRMVEIHALGDFEVTGDYEMFFSGQAKTRDADDAKDSYHIPTLFPSSTLLKAWDYLKQCDRILPKEKQLADTKAVNKAYNMALSRAMSRYPFNYKGLRAIYAECQWFLFEDKGKVEKHAKFSDWLGHLDKDGASDSTFMSYMVFDIQDLVGVFTE